MAYYRRCPRCGAYNDPGEICDCQDDEEKEATPAASGMTSGTRPFPSYQGAIQKSIFERRLSLGRQRAERSACAVSAAG